MIQSVQRDCSSRPDQGRSLAAGAAQTRQIDFARRLESDWQTVTEVPASAVFACSGLRIDAQAPRATQQHS